MTLDNIRVQRKTLEELEEQFGIELFNLSAVGISNDFIGITYQTNTTYLKNIMNQLLPLNTEYDTNGNTYIERVLEGHYKIIEDICIKIMNETATMQNKVLLKYHLTLFYCAYNIHHNENPPSFFVVINNAICGGGEN
jgi:hypothetical protein